MTHTKGPWYPESFGRLHVQHKNTGYKIDGVCMVNRYHIPKTEAWANARLIAAAPDLLEALEDIRSIERPEFIGAPQYWMEKIISRCNEAIDKAKS